MPVRVEPLSLIAGYVAVLTFFFFGGPAVFIGTLFAWDTGPTLAVRAAGVLVAAVLGPLPPALFGRAALRARRSSSPGRPMTSCCAEWAASPTWRATA